MGVLPGRSIAKARGWGFLCLQRGQQLRPISAGFQVLIRKGGMQRGPLGIPQHRCAVRCSLFLLSFGALQDSAFPFLASNRIWKGKQKQVPTSKDRLHLGGACLGHTHHTEVEGAEVPRKPIPVPMASKWSSTYQCELKD